MNKEIISPVTLTGEVNKIEDFDVKQIIKSYSNIGIDVSKYFKSLEVVSLYECVRTGYRFYYPFEVIGDDNFYEDLSKNRPNYYSSRWEHKRALCFLKKSDSVLEIGSGFGAFAEFLKSNSINNLVGLELNPLAVKKCNELGFNVKQVLIQDEALNHFETYDAVCYFQVLEHITDVRSFIQSSLDSLKKGGRLIIGVPNNNPYLFINDKWHTLNLPPHHAGLWNKKSLKALENIFSISLENIEFEPLENTYDYFIKVQLENSTFFKRSIIKIFNKFTPRLFKKFCCSFVKGRNIFVVFVKK